MTVSEQQISYGGSNVPNVLTLYVIELGKVLSVLDPLRHRLPGANLAKVTAGALVLRNGSAFTKMKFPPLACVFTQTIERGDAGNAYNMLVEFAMPGSRENMLAFFNENSQKQFVCLVEDGNRQAYILGNEERGLRMIMGQSVSGINAYTVNFSGKLNVPAFLMETSLSGLVLAEQFPDTDFSIDFSLDLNA